MKRDPDPERCTRKCKGGTVPPATNVARRVNKVVTKFGTNDYKGGVQALEGQAYLWGDFSKSKNDLNRGSLTAAPVEKRKQHGCELNWEFTMQQIKI